MVWTALGLQCFPLPASIWDSNARSLVGRETGSRSENGGASVDLYIGESHSPGHYRGNSCFKNLLVKAKHSFTSFRFVLGQSKRFSNISESSSSILTLLPLASNPFLLLPEPSPQRTWNLLCLAVFLFAVCVALV